MDLGILILACLAIGTLTFAVWIALMVREMVSLARKIMGQDHLMDNPDDWDWMGK